MMPGDKSKKEMIEEMYRQQMASLQRERGVSYDLNRIDPVRAKKKEAKQREDCGRTSQGSSQSVGHDAVYVAESVGARGVEEHTIPPKQRVL